MAESWSRDHVLISGAEWDLVCENSWLKTLAKMLLFTGFALGSFCSGLVSDR